MNTNEMTTNEIKTYIGYGDTRFSIGDTVKVNTKCGNYPGTVWIVTGHRENKFGTMINLKCQKGNKYRKVDSTVAVFPSYIVKLA